MLSALLDRLGLRELLPEGPVITPWERFERWGWARAADVTYQGPPKVDFAVLPLQAFGARYHLDLVLVSNHPEWHMHEYAMLQTHDGPLWFAKDARSSTRNQSIVADVPELNTWFPELPLERRATPVDVIDRSCDGQLDLELAYTNLDGEAVEVSYQGPAPRAPQPKRNGSTMGHSRQQLLAVIDISHRNFAKRARISIGNQRRAIKRILGLVPFQMVLSQTQGGVSTGQFCQRADPKSDVGFCTVHTMPYGPDIPQSWEGRAAEGELWVIQRSELRTLHYRFLDHDGALELASITATQWGDATPTFHMALDPALPDVRRRFEGHVESRYVMDVNGQPGYAVGRVVCCWEGDVVHVDLKPEAPWWTTDRPMQTTVHYDPSGDVDVAIRRI